VAFQIVFVKALPKVMDAPVFAIEENDSGLIGLDVQTGVVDETLQKGVAEQGSIPVVARVAQQYGLKFLNGGTCGFASQTGENFVGDCFGTFCITNGIQAQAFLRAFPGCGAVDAGIGFLREAGGAVHIEIFDMDGALPFLPTLNIICRSFPGVQTGSRVV